MTVNGVAEGAALADQLTGLPSRSLFGDRTGQALRRAQHGQTTAVLLLDLDRFKHVNDTFGHEAGDGLLLTIADRLRAAIGPLHTLARLGGDEFAVLCESLPGERGAIEIAERLLDALRMPVGIDDRPVFVTASVGIVVAADGIAAPETLMRDAEVAMYRAKDQGGGRYELYDEGMRRRLVERMTLEYDMRRALDQREFLLHFQPIISLAERRVAGVEALVRWQHPELGLVPPDAFLPIAEQSGLIVPLGRWILAEACRQIARWSAHPTIDVPYVSVNLSGRQLADLAFPDELADLLRRSGIPPDRLALELTETVLMEDTVSPTAVVQRLEELGVRLLLDDFGTGYSSLNYLKRFPIQALKVDRSFIAGITEDDADRHIFRAIAQMARGLGVEVIAEGIETIEQAQCVRSLGCELAQGYLFAAPVTAPAVEGILRDGVPFAGLDTAFEAPSVEVPPSAQGVSAARDELSEAEAAEDNVGPTVALGEAAAALRVSASTLRRWADAGRIGSVRTSGGHRRFAVSEIGRLNQRDMLSARPVVRAVVLPPEPLPALADMLATAGRSIAEASAKALYERSRAGWFASDDADQEFRRWSNALAVAARSGTYDRAIEATGDFLRQAHYAGASLLERHMFIERYADLTVRALQQRGVDHAELVGARRLFARLRQALLEATGADS